RVNHRLSLLFLLLPRWECVAYCELGPRQINAFGAPNVAQTNHQQPNVSLPDSPSIPTSDSIYFLLLTFAFSLPASFHAIARSPPPINLVADLADTSPPPASRPGRLDPQTRIGRRAPTPVPSRLHRD
ncbi:hypothetical protein BC826DRAFT_1185385, partial [Russula brevipes]